VRFLGVFQIVQLVDVESPLTRPLNVTVDPESVGLVDVSLQRPRTVREVKVQSGWQHEHVGTYAKVIGVERDASSGIEVPDSSRVTQITVHHHETIEPLREIPVRTLHHFVETGGARLSYLDTE
jgi:hypothetical protein